MAGFSPYRIRSANFDFPVSSFRFYRPEPKEEFASCQRLACCSLEYAEECRGIIQGACPEVNL